jgi:hypothetical protein
MGSEDFPISVDVNLRVISTSWCNLRDDCSTYSNNQSDSSLDVMCVARSLELFSTRRLPNSVMPRHGWRRVLMPAQRNYIRPASLKYESVPECTASTALFRRH